MTVNRTYQCNLCHDQHDVNGDELIGIYWTPQAPDWKEHIISKPVREVEHHICRRCLMDLTKIAVRANQAISVQP